MNQVLRRKAVISGSTIEVLAFYDPGIVGTSAKIFSAEQLAERKRLKELYNSGIEIPDPEKTAPSVRRCRSELRRIILANAYAWKDKNGNRIPAKFLTLTFKQNIQDLKSANYYLTKYIQRLNYQFRNHLAESLKYVCVSEFQNRGAVHYHLVLFNFPFVDRVYTKLRDVWGGDRIHLETIQRRQSISHIISYVSKYITKQTADGRFWGQKRYFASRGLTAPIVLRDDIAIELLVQRVECYEKTRKVFNIPFCGNVDYYLYDLGECFNINSLANLDSYVKEQILLSKK